MTLGLCPRDLVNTLDEAESSVHIESIPLSWWMTKEDIQFSFALEAFRHTSPHALCPKFNHCGLMNLDQLGDVLVCVCGAYKAMIGWYVQPVHPVQQSKARTSIAVSLARIADAVHRPT